MTQERSAYLLHKGSASEVPSELKSIDVGVAKARDRKESRVRYEDPKRSDLTMCSIRANP